MTEKLSRELSELLSEDAVIASFTDGPDTVYVQVRSGDGPAPDPVQVFEEHTEDHIVGVECPEPENNRMGYKITRKEAA